MKRSLLCLAFLFTGGSAWGQAVLNPKCAKTIRIRAPQNGAGVYFDRTCRTAYVLPPAVGDVQLAALSRTSALDDCRALANFTRGLESISSQWANIASEIDRGRVSTPVESSPLFPAPGPAPVSPGPSEQEIAEWQRRIDALMDAYGKARDRLKPFWETPAATAQMVYQVHHQRLVTEYQRLNPQYGFRALPLRESKIYLARKVGNAEQRMLYPAVVFASIPGYAPGNENGELGRDDGLISGEAQSGQLGLSLMGICPYYNALSGRLPDQLVGRDLAANMVANVRYVYELQATRKYRATYNVGAMLRRLQTTESRGGFFTTRAINKLIVERSSRDEFDIEVESDDGRWQYDDQMAQTIKAQIFDRAFQNLVHVSGGEPVAAPAAVLPSTNGAQAAATELGKCPHLYCQIASGVLHVGNAIFGSAETVNEYINRVDVSVTESATENKMLTYHGTVTFTSR